MKSKKWLICFISVVTAVILLFAGFNFVTDPIGVFGDRFLNWYSFDMTNNPRAAKIAYLDKNYEKYDSYIIGCSSTSSLPPDAFDKYTGANFYNMIMYGADMLDVEQISEYLIENYTVKNLVVNVFLSNGAIYDEETDRILANQHAKTSGENAIAFYSRYLFLNPRYGISKLFDLKNDTFLSQPFDVFDIKTGTYDKRKRDAEPIGSVSDYLKAYPGFADYPVYTVYMNKIDQTMESLRRIKSLCEQEDVNLTLISTPVYIDHFKCFPTEQVEYFFTSLASVAPFWDFSMSSVSLDMRYFYDETHFRNAPGYMAAARIYGDDSMYVPDDFGVYVTQENVAEHVAGFASVSADVSEYTAQLPVLMYHHLDDTGDGSMTISADAFDHQLGMLREHDYTPITLDELTDYVCKGMSLPEKPVLITFDDGYMSNYTLAYPLLKKYNMPATIFVIGTSVGADTYKGTPNAIIPHFGWNEASEMSKSGLILIQSHTYDMHQWAPFEDSESPRENILMFDGEDEDDYISLLTADFEKSRTDIADNLGLEVTALAYPGGKYDLLAQAILNSLGIKITFSTDVGVNTVIRGLPQSLYALKRFNINGETTDAEFLSYLDGSFESVS